MPSPSSKYHPAILTALSWRFLPVALLFRASNWLQGPYFYQLYSSKHHIMHDLPGGMTTLYVSGYLAGMTAGTLVGSFTDRCGRRNGCLWCGLAFAFTCLTAHSDHLAVLLLGRLTAGIASTLLHSAFEAWLVSEATRVGGPEHKLSLVSSVLSTQTSMSSFIAIVSGAVATYSVNMFGVTGASDLSFCLLAIGLTVMLCTWGENVGRLPVAESEDNRDSGAGKSGGGGAKKSGNGGGGTIGDDGKGKDDQGSGSTSTTVAASSRSAFSVLVSQPNIIALGVVQVAYEGCMHVFITLWPEMLQGTVGAGVPIQFGYVFSGLMMSVMLGSTLYKKYTTLPQANNVVACAVMLGIATLALTLPLVLVEGQFTAMLGAFLLFEMTAGGYHPCMGAMRTRLVPSDVSASMITLFRVPQNLLVVVLLLWSKKGRGGGKGGEESGEGSGGGHTRLLGACGLVLFVSMVVLLVVEVKQKVKQKKQ